MADQAVRIGIVGCGNVMRGSYMPLVNRLRDQGQVTLVAACDIDASKQAFVVDTLGVPRFTTDYQELVSMDDVDLVLVLTSMPAHGRVARAALQTGKHVLVEKPMAVTLEEAAELVELARKSPGILLPAPHVVLSKAYRSIWQHLQRGDIGQVLSARAFYGWAGPDWSEWFYQPGGGALFDLGVYNVTTLTGLLGPAQRVTALAGVAIPQRPVNGKTMTVDAVDNAHVLLDFGKGVYAVVTTGFTIQKYRCPAVELYGRDGTIQMLGDDWAPRGYEIWQNSVGAWQLYEGADTHWPWTDGLRHLVECIQTGTRPLITPEHAYHVLEIMLSAEAAGKDGQARTLQSNFTPPRFEDAGRSDAAHRVHDRTRED